MPEVSSMILTSTTVGKVLKLMLVSHWAISSYLDMSNIESRFKTLLKCSDHLSRICAGSVTGTPSFYLMGGLRSMYSFEVFIEGFFCTR